MICFCNIQLGVRWASARVGIIWTDMTSAVTLLHIAAQKMQRQCKIYFWDHQYIGITSICTGNHSSTSVYCPKHREADWC